MGKLTAVLLTVVLACACAAAGATAGAGCEHARSLTASGITVTMAQEVPAGALALPDIPVSTKDLPAFCRVAATLTPTADSQIRIEVWLPTDSWNGKLLALGNGGWGGRVDHGLLAFALREHYAAAATDTGHEGNTGSFALGHPEKLIDYAYRAVHEMTVASKRVISAVYGTDPKLSYFVGGSTGGRQGLMEAQRYPADFDGIIAVAPANNRSRRNVAGMATLVAMASGKLEPLPDAKALLLHNAVLTACDSIDGVKDGLLEDPRKCHFDPATLACRDGATDNCLTPAQLEMAKLAYAPVKTTRGELVFPGWEPGSELFWPHPGADGPEPRALDIFRYVSHQDPHWDWRTFDIDKDLPLLLKTGGAMDAISPDLRAFKQHGGKLLIVHGWSDGIAPQNSINYYDSVMAEMGGPQDDWFRMFMVPGMAHGVGRGSAPDPLEFIIPILRAFEAWCERGIPPNRIVVHLTENHVDMTHPLCPYPSVAQWTGAGSTIAADNYMCSAPASPSDNRKATY